MLEVAAVGSTAVICNLGIRECLFEEEVP